MLETNSISGDLFDFFGSTTVGVVMMMNSFLVTWLLDDVGAQEEVEKQDEIAHVHEQRVFGVVVSGRAWPSLGFILLSIHDINAYDEAHDHLKYLKARNDHGELVGHVDAHGFERVVAVHD